ncbi:MAG: GAF domain-containing protein, partial [Arcobacteraceae bacterium]
MNNFNNMDRFIDLITDIVFVKDINGVFTNCNEKYLNFIGKTRDEVIGKSDKQFLSKEDELQVTQNDNKVILNKETIDFYDTIYLNDTYIYFKTTKKPLFDIDNNVIGIFCIARDITIQKHYEIIYNDTNKLLEYIAMENDLDKVLDKIVKFAHKRDKSSKCSILLLNDTKKNLLLGASIGLPDYYNQAINGIEIGDKIGSCGSAAFNKKRVIVEDIDSHENWSNYLALTKRAKLHSCWSEPIFSSDNKILGTFALYRDHSSKPSEFELRLIETYAYMASVAIIKYKNQQTLIQKETLLLNQSKMVAMGEMIGNISHQWRQPLSVISTGATGLLLQKEHDCLTDDIFDKTCNAINDNAQYLSKTIDDFKNFVKGDREKKLFKLDHEITSFLHLVEGTIRTNTITMNIDLKDEIEINGYENELLQCLINIFNNSKDVLNEKEIKNKHIFLSSSIQDNNALITVKDNGGGIPNDAMPKIFEPYFTTKHKSQGTGLGLHMTYNLIVDGMNG